MSLPSWHDITPGSLKLPDAQTFEPSGLTLYTDSNNDPWIFVVGDSGKVIKAKINHSRDGKPGDTSWHGPDTFAASDIPVALNDDSVKPNDFECVTFANGNVMIGVEGDRPYDTATGKDDGSDDAKTPPHILRFDQEDDDNGNIKKVGTLTGSSWDLTDLLPSGAKKNAGMEGLTFIPNGYFPSTWSDGGHYGGIFLATTQSSGGTAQAYCLAQGSDRNGKTQEDLASSAVATLTIPAPSTDGPLISELFFDTQRGCLWVLYDGGASSDYLQALTLDTTDGTLTQAWADNAPWLGVEGMAVDGDDLYLAIDNNDDTDGVYVLSGFASKVMPISQA